MEIDARASPIGELSLRRRRIAGLGVEAYEIKLGDEYLMSSLFTESERALGEFGVAAAAGENLDVVVGGLGLGYTAQAVLRSPRVRSLLVIEALEAVIGWHRDGLLPLGRELVADKRCRIVHGDFFALAASDGGFDPQEPGRQADAILVDIDHSPDQWLAPANESFYRPEGLRRAAGHLRPEGVFGLWSNDPPDPRFIRRLASVFAEARAEPVTFENPLQDREHTQAVYLARR